MLKYHYIAKTDVGLVRQANEDNLGDAQTPNGHVFVVCDGMGGHVGGARASQIAVNSILEYFSKELYENIFTAIDRSLQFANEQIFAVAINEPEMKGMGTTAVVLVIKNDNCYIGHVGDSRIYLKSNGRLNRVTKDHSFVQNLVDQGIISDDDAENHPKKNQILKALGISPNIEPTIANEPLLVKNSDVFLLCSDGLNGMVNDHSMEMMIDSSNIEQSANNLINAARDSGGHDNITATLVVILESPHQNSRFNNFNPTSIQNFSQTLLIEEDNVLKSKSYKKLIISAFVFLVFLTSSIAWVVLRSDKGSENPPLSGEKSHDKNDDESDNFDSNSNSNVMVVNTNEDRDKNKKITTKRGNPKKQEPKAKKGSKSKVDHEVESNNEIGASAKKTTAEKETDCDKTLTYTVKKGQTFDIVLSQINKKCPNTIKNEILKDNKIADENKIREGEKIKYKCKCD